MGGDVNDFETARVKLACGRIAASADAIVEAYRFGASEGQCGMPWQAEYHRNAVTVYFEALPATYQLDVARLFVSCDRVMSRGMIPADLADDWVIVRGYLREAGTSIARLMTNKALTHETVEESLEDSAEDVVGATDLLLTDSPPRVIRYDKLAGLTTREGAARLHLAALTVQQHFDQEEPADFSEHDRHLLYLLASGKHISEIAAEVMYSERSVYRELSNLWDKLGVHGRKDGLIKAVESGLLD